MLSALLDTNILLDLLLEDRPESTAAAELVEFVAENRVRCCVGASSLKDVYYVARKYQPDEVVRTFIGACMDLFEVLPLDEATCRAALNSSEPDFEDGIVREGAESAGCDLIVTRDAAAFMHAHLRSVTATELVELVKS